MANRLNADLTGKVVVLDPKYLSSQYQALKWRLFRAEGGFGCSPETEGKAVFGTFLADGEEARMEGFMIQRFAVEDDMPRCPSCGQDALVECYDDCPNVAGRFAK